MLIPREVSKHESIKIIAKYTPIGQFYMFDNETKLYIGIDNSQRHAWVEEFKTKQVCLEWLKS